MGYQEVDDRSGLKQGQGPIAPSVRSERLPLTQAISMTSQSHRDDRPIGVRAGMWAASRSQVNLPNDASI